MLELLRNFENHQFFRRGKVEENSSFSHIFLRREERE